MNNETVCPQGRLERIVRRRDDVCEWCDVQGRCSSGTKYVWVYGKGRVESPCMCACHSSPSKKPHNTCSAAPLSLIPQPNTGPADKNPE